jgi:hypothetical protein
LLLFIAQGQAEQVGCYLAQPGVQAGLPKSAAAP